MWLSKAKGLLIALVLCLLLSACSESSTRKKEELIVFAASSLTDVLSQIETEFEKEHTDIDVKLNFAGSKTLRSQIENGAQPSLFLSANEGHYKALENQNLFEMGSAFAKNEMVIIVQKNASVQMNDLGDLSGDLQLVLAEPSVPAGDYARSVIASYDKAKEDGFEEKVLANLVSEESNVRQVLMKVALGEADVGIVYGTDVVGAVADKLEVIQIPSAYNVVANYYMGMLKSSESYGAQAFYDYIQSQEGKTILSQYGFLLND